MKGVYPRKTVLPGTPKQSRETPSCGVDPHMLTSALIYGSRTTNCMVGRTHDDDPARAEYVCQLVNRLKNDPARRRAAIDTDTQEV